MVMFPVHHARNSEKGKKTRKTEEEVGRQHQGMDRPGVRQVPEGSGEQGKLEKTGCKIICCTPTTLAVKGLMMMMMIIIHCEITLPLIAKSGVAWQRSVARSFLALSREINTMTQSGARARDSVPCRYIG